jgi:diacylglycerol kinase (ATP)
VTTPPGRRRPRIALVINPAAGRGAGARAGQRAAAVLRDGAELTVLQPAGGAAGSLAALVAVLRDRPDAVLVCGGDGMAHLAVNALAGGEVPLGVIPGGTGNDAAEVLGMHRDPAVAAGQLLRALVAGAVRRIDVGRCDGPALLPGTTRAFLGLLYAGFDSAVNDRANRMRHPRGPARYTIALAVEAIRLQARPFRFCLDDVETRVPATLVAVGNGPQYGGGKLIAPQARWDDGVLGVTVVGPVSRMTLARLAPTLPHAGHVGHPCVRLHSAHHVVLDAADTMAYADGEPVGPLPVRVWADPGALPVLVPVPG